ncbi:hypothetical protein CF58_30770 [Escherichia coli]|nr:hypothetical protein CF58_30770 [Escherichia coli]
MLHTGLKVSASSLNACQLRTGIFLWRGGCTVAADNRRGDGGGPLTLCLGNALAQFSGAGLLGKDDVLLLQVIDVTVGFFSLFY